MARSLKEILLSEYGSMRHGESLTNRRGDHLTPYLGVCHAILIERIPIEPLLLEPLLIEPSLRETRLIERQPRDLFFSRWSRPGSVHIYDITENTFILELRNLPRSTAVERLLINSGAEIDDGQTYSTCRLCVNRADSPLLIQLAGLIRRVRRDGRNDGILYGEQSPYAVAKALLTLASVLELAD